MYCCRLLQRKVEELQARLLNTPERDTESQLIQTLRAEKVHFNLYLLLSHMHFSKLWRKCFDYAKHTILSSR